MERVKSRFSWTDSHKTNLSNIFKSGELDEEVVIAKISTTTQHGALEGKTQSSLTNYYNLDAIISVGYEWIPSRQLNSIFEQRMH